MGTVSPYQIFPEEIWEIILDKCEDGTDIVNVLLTFPQLTNLSWGKQSSWLIGEIIPLIFPKLICFQDIKSCRLVSKRWRNAVDKTLVTQTNVLPYGSLAGIPETHFNYREFRGTSTNIFNFLWFGHAVDYEIDTKWAIANPFPERRVHIDLDILYAYSEYYETIKHYGRKWRAIPLNLKSGGNGKERLLSTLEMVGHHVWFADFELPYTRHWVEKTLLRDFMQHLFQCLSHLPNLKSLTIGGVNRGYEKIDDERKNIIIAALNESCIAVYLETLDLWTSSIHADCIIPTDLYNSFLTFFVNKNHVKKLVIHTGHWNENMHNMFPNLTELCLKEDKSASKQYLLENILRSLDGFRCLKKLSVFSITLKATKILHFISTEIIESLELHLRDPQCGMSSSKGNRICKSVASKISKILIINGPLNWISSIRVLKVHIHYRLNFKFLSWLPTLQVLFLIVPNASVMFFDQYDGDDIVSECVHNICKMYTCNSKCLKKLWEAYPHLNVFTLDLSSVLYQFVREDPERVFKSA